MTATADMYRMAMGSNVWTLTSADEDKFYDAGSGDERYVVTPLGRSDIQQRNELSKANLEVRIPLEHPLAIMLLTSFVEQQLSLTVFTDRGGVVSVSWKGRLAGVKPGDKNLVLDFESIFTSLRRPGLRARYQKSCRFALYGRGCTLDPEDFVTDTTLSAINNSVLTVPGADALADGYFTGGMIRAPDGVLSFIISHTADLLTLQRVSLSLRTAFAATGAATPVKIYPGCDHSRATCWAKFNNGLNYGGFDWIPTRNPMGGTSIV